MKPIMDRAITPHRSRIAGTGEFSATLVFQPAARVDADSSNWLLLPPPADRGQSSTRAKCATAPAPGPGGVSISQVSKLEEATREWLIWRFSDNS